MARRSRGGDKAPRRAYRAALLYLLCDGKPDLIIPQNRIEQATAICERPQVTKHKEPRKLQKEIETLQRALKDRERRQGATLDQILEELEVRKKAAAEAVKATNELSGLIEVRLCPSRSSRFAWLTRRIAGARQRLRDPHRSLDRLPLAHRGES